MQFYPFLVPTLYDISWFFQQQADESLYPPTLSLSNNSLAGNKVFLLDAEDCTFVWLQPAMHDILIDALLGDDWKERELASDFYHTVEVRLHYPRNPCSNARRHSRRSCLPSSLGSNATSCSLRLLFVSSCQARVRQKRPRRVS